MTGACVLFARLLGVPLFERRRSVLVRFLVAPTACAVMIGVSLTSCMLRTVRVLERVLEHLLLSGPCCQ